MIKVKDLFEAIHQKMDIDGNIISMDVETDEENTPVKIILRSDIPSTDNPHFIEVTITENGSTFNTYE